jgi:hypothetical protein
MQKEMIEDDELQNSQTKIQLPLTMKKHLVDEWELIVEEPRKLLQLPRVPCVAQVLDDFLQNKFMFYINSKEK